MSVLKRSKDNSTQKDIDELLLNYKNEPSKFDYYHPTLTREKAEILLIKHYKENNIDGYFLLRSRSNLPNEFSLSIIFKDKCEHYKIDDKLNGCYSIKDDQPVFGIERLIKSYQREKQSLNCILSEEYIRGELLPEKIRLYGVKNLLHETVAQVKEIKNVRLILNSQYCPDINERNEEGRTALDIACEYDNVDVIKELIKKNPLTNLVASDGYTPLHRAAEHNAMHSIDYLLTNKHANPTLRLIDNNFVPLHVAAANNNFMCVRMLLKHNVPDKPRDTNKKTPLEIARERNFHETIKELTSHKNHKAKTNQQEWLHDWNIKRIHAKKILSNAIKELKNGVFLVRTKKTNGIQFALSLMSSPDSFTNYEISEERVNNENFFYIDDGPYFESLEQLIEYYMKYEDGLPSKLLHPIGPNSEYIQISANSEGSRESVLISEEQKDKEETEKRKAKKKELFKHHASSSDNSKTDTKLRTIKISDLKFGEKIGEGEFGIVYKGALKGSRQVAIKVLNDFGSSKEFLKEVEIMKKLGNHPCIIRIFGIIEEKKKFMMVQELMVCSLLDKLHELPHTVTDYNFKNWAIEIVSGMEHMESKKIVHRDLAARNILLGSNFQAKIADFGLSRKYENEYTQTSDCKIPIKWYAPESIEKCKFTSKSDVWSFGVTLWEMWTYGETPYGDKNGVEVYNYIKIDRRLERPNNCSDSSYMMMMKCWEWNEEKRPSFHNLKNDFKVLTEDETTDYINLNGIYL